MEEERGLALFLEGGIFLGVLPPVASRSWHRCIADSAVLLVGHFECLLCNSPAFDLAYLSTSEVVPPSLVLHVSEAALSRPGSEARTGCPLPLPWGALARQLEPP